MGSSTGLVECLEPAHPVGDDVQQPLGMGHVVAVPELDGFPGVPIRVSCRKTKNLDKAAPSAPLAPALASASGLGAPADARRAPPVGHADQGGSLGGQAGTARGRLPGRTIIQLAATASRALPAVASHAIGSGDARLNGHSQGIGAHRGRREQSRTPTPPGAVPGWSAGPRGSPQCRGRRGWPFQSRAAHWTLAGSNGGTFGPSR